MGGGRWGTHWLRNLLAHPDLTVVAIADADADQLQRLATQFDLSPAVQRFSSGTALLSDCPALDAVVVATPASTHYDLIHQALQRGCHVLAEKPLTLDPQSAIALCEQADRAQRLLVVDHTYLFHPAVQAGRDWISTQSLAPLHYGYAARTHLGPIRQDVDALWDLAIHDLAILNHWFGEFPVSGQAIGQVWLQGDRPQPPLFPQGLADQVQVQLTYPSGAQATIHLCWANPDKQRRLGMVSDRGTLVFDELQTEAPLVFYGGDVGRQAQGFKPQPQAPLPIAIAATEPLRTVCHHFVECIQQQQPSQISSGWLGADLVQLLTDLTQSLNQGGQPVPLAIAPRP